ncbi:pectinesterase family protein [Flavobacterium agrisoli]|uniref:Pectinesterase catalytic domain-containing protein n=1 Tax=Flavobacterium agrisoli TaxID=2793066 RepID=A0A934PMY9_9FLAO|nr:pectinesterase family protein [Flavobacterium agrisoli]MBK0369893.1 hypothetical protein [Flavobacterium agrisoli]
MKKNYLFFLLLILNAILVRGQITNTTTYDFTDGTIIAAKQSADGKLTLGGAYIWHNSDPKGYGLNLKENQEINIAVPGSCTIRFVGSQYSGLKLTGTAGAVNLGTQVTKVVNDKVDAYDFVYSGVAAVLNFKAVAGTGGDIYLPKLEVIPAQLGKDFTTAGKNITYTYDLRDSSIIPSTYPGNNYELGLFKIEAGCCNAYSLNGTQHGIVFKTGNKITLKVAGNSYIRLATDQYSGGTITASSTTGAFDVTSKSNTGTTFSTAAPKYVDFLYVGTAGTVTLESFGGTNYLPYIEVSPVPYDVSLASYKQKTGTITINGTTITLQSGADAASNATVTLSSGTLISATSTKASIRINLGGAALSSLTPTVSGDIASASIVNDVLTVTYTENATDPKSYEITIKDNSVVANPEFGKSYAYNFADASEMPQTSYTTLRYNTYVTKDGLVAINSNTTNDAIKFGFHDATHGGVFYSGNSFDIAVAGNATITFVACTYGSSDAVLEFRDANNKLLETIKAQNKGLADAQPFSFSYTGPKGIITAKLVSTASPAGEIYLHSMNVENAAEIIASNGKIDVWDFGAKQLSADLYNNKLTETAINDWYPKSVTTGSTTNTLPSFSAGVLSWVGGTNDRLRTANTNLTRFDDTFSGTADYQGRVYVNASAAVGRYMSLTLSADDEVTIIAKTDDKGLINFEYVGNPAEQTDKLALSSTITELKFVAKKAGTYHIFDTQNKPSYYRIYRKDASYANLTGVIDLTQANGIPANYNVLFTNEAGKVFNATVASGNYSVKLPIGYTYKLSLANANGYVIDNETTLQVTPTTTNYNLIIKKVALFTVTGNVVGYELDPSKVVLTYTPDVMANKIYVPMPVVNPTTGAYTVDLEPNTLYTISAQNVNDFEIVPNTITITDNTTRDVFFRLKQKYPIAINTTGLNETQLESLKLKFTNLNESGYAYEFNTLSEVALRNGTYSITATGLNSSEVVMTLTSNLKVADAATIKTLDFVPPPATAAIGYMPVITVGKDKSYKTITEALSDVKRMTRTATERVTIMIDPGNYEEMLVINQPNVTLKNAAATPSIALANKGVDIDPNAVRITSYYGHGYNYYSMSNDQKWHADVLKVNKENGSLSYENKGSGTTNGSYWNATVVVSASGFQADDIIFENSFNQYISKKESEDVVVMWATGGKGIRPTNAGNTAVQNKSFVERAAALSILDNTDKVILNKCRVIGRQDSFYGGKKARVAIYKGVMMGGTDYIFGGMNAVFYKSDLAMNTSEDNNDVSYITAAQQDAGRGYLMYECKVTSALPGTETASAYRSKPGYFGRPWAATTSEVVFFNTTIETSDNPSFNGQSLIVPVGWNNGLGGESKKMYEYGTKELSGVNNQATRASWATTLSTITNKTTANPTLADGTEITTLNFTQGNDGWDPFDSLIAADVLGTKSYQPTTQVQVYALKNRIVVSNVKEATTVTLYNLSGALVKTITTFSDTEFEFKKGIWIAVINAPDGQKSVKLITH